ncbi:MAG: hypothetical protein LBQ28_05320 [Prevotellaceae bacterium]|jgi:hypothetical protein|nr:hypothetical protein [Prevotellaceae bacterium]
MKKYFTTIIFAVLFCGNMFSQEPQVTFPHILIEGHNSTPNINANCNEGYYDIEITISYSYTGTVNNLYAIFNNTLVNTGYDFLIAVTDVSVTYTTNNGTIRYGTISLHISENKTQDINLKINGADGGYANVHQTACPPPPPNPMFMDASDGNWIIKNNLH